MKGCNFHGATGGRGECPACVATWAEQAKVDRAYEIGALAMAHYYHGDYAFDEFKMDHGNRAMRREHLDWARDNYDRLKAELDAEHKVMFKDVPLTEEPQ